MLQSEKTDVLTKALIEVQKSMEFATLNKTNPHFKNKYADLRAVIEAISEPLTNNGFAVTQTTEMRDGAFMLVTTLRHDSGQWVASEYPLPIGKPQEMGSAISYARRYSLSSIVCNAADEDDDAEGARQKEQTAAPKAKPTAVKPTVTQAPVDPATGEVGPHEIKFDGDFVKFGGLLVAGIKTARDAKELKAWSAKNKKSLDAMGQDAPKVYERVEANILDMETKLTQPVKEAAE